MISEAELMFQLGAIMLLAFIAATMAGKLNQSVMMGYVVIGVLIGPRMNISFLGMEYHGLVTETTFVQLLSQIGLIMLMFFVGLEFSFSKLKKTRTPAIILAVIDTSVGLFVGFLFASYLGWPLIDSIFLAGVISMSSTSIAMKVLFDLKRMSSPEVEFLIGLVVVETFIAMIILAVASGMMVQSTPDVLNYGRLILSIAAFYAFFVWIAMWAVPRVVSFFAHIDNDELFILFALGIVFLTAGVAAVMNVPPIIGAFFIGMILAESKVTTRIQSKLESFKDAFVAIFFTTFGMMIDPAMFKDVLWMVVIAVCIALVYEVFVISSIAYFMGFSSKASATIGTSMCGRGVESILYASVGSKVQGATMGATLNPFTGAYCFVMSCVTPVLVKHSSRLASVLTRLIPLPLRFSGSVISRTLSKAVMPSGLHLFKRTKATGALLAAFVAADIAVLMSQSYLRMSLTLAGLVLAGTIFFVLTRELREIARHVNYANIGVGTDNKENIVYLGSGLVFGTALAVLLIVFSWPFGWVYSMGVAAGYLAFVICLMLWGYVSLYSGEYVQRKVYTFPRPLVEDSEPMPDIPKPVYGMVRSHPSESLHHYTGSSEPVGSLKLGKLI